MKIILYNKGLKIFSRHVHSGHMGILPSAIGYDPIIRLQSGGLKAGEALLCWSIQTIRI